MGRILAAAASVLPAALVATGCGSRAASEPPGLPVRVQEVAPAAGAGGVRYSANVIPRAQVDVAFKVNGYIDEIRQVRGADGRMRDLQQGDVVAEGSMLAKIKDAEYQDQVKKARANLAKAEASLEKGTSDFRRASNLNATNSITGPDYDAAKEEYESARAAVEGARAQLNEAELNLGYATLTAPMAGVLLKRRIEVGTLVGPGTVAFVLADVSSVKVAFGVPDVLLGSVALGRTIHISTASVPGKVFTGRVTAVAPAADASTRVSEVEVTVPNPDGELRDGMVAALEVPAPAGPAAAALRDALAVPLAAVVQPKVGPPGYAVFVVAKDGPREVARLRRVELGQVVGNAILVTEGLEAGDRVVVTGATIVRDGDAVRPIP